jgi:hypothetical protein
MTLQSIGWATAHLVRQVVQKSAVASTVTLHRDGSRLKQALQNVSEDFSLYVIE